MAEIVFQVVAFGFENVVVLIFDLPASPAISDDGFNGRFDDFKIGDEGVFVDLLARVFSGYAQFAPVDLEGPLITPQGQLVGIPIGIDFAKTTIPAPF